MILIDSSGWLQYFLGYPLADVYGEYVEGADPIVVPAVVLYEVYKTLLRLVSVETADEAALQLTHHLLVPLDAELALAAAEISLRHRLPFADAVIYAAAETHEATIVTSDQHFEGLDRVQYIPKP